MAGGLKITEKNIGQVEKDTIEIASSTISALESALASWEATEKKPKELVAKFKRYAWFRDALAEWMTNTLRSTDDDFQSRLKKLAEYAAICRQYKGV